MAAMTSGLALFGTQGSGVVSAEKHQAVEDEAAKMNVLLILSDDLNTDYTDPRILTPNLDRLASRGVRFDRAYCNYPVCGPSRVSLLSGRYPHTTQVLDNGVNPRVALGDTVRFLPEYFSSRGYFTAAMGKVLHSPTITHHQSIQWDYALDPVFDLTYEFFAGNSLARASRNLPDEKHPDGISARRIARLMADHQDTPWLLTAGFWRPHAPRLAPQTYFDLYPLDQIEVPTGTTDPAIPKLAIPPQYDPNLTDEAKAEIIQSYYACVSFMDAQVGVLLDTLDRLDLWDRTVVIFLGDNGWHLGEHGGFWGKQSLMDRSVRVPLIVSAPGFGAGAVCTKTVEHVDIFPSLVELCRLPQPSGLEGQSIVPLLRNPNDPSWHKVARSVVVRGKQGGMLELGRSAHSDRHTLIEWPDNSLQMFDDQKDPGQRVNLAANPEFRPVIEELKAHLMPRTSPAHRGEGRRPTEEVAEILSATMDSYIAQKEQKE